MNNVRKYQLLILILIPVGIFICYIPGYILSYSRGMSEYWAVFVGPLFYAALEGVPIAIAVIIFGTVLPPKIIEAKKRKATQIEAEREASTRILEVNLEISNLVSNLQPGVTLNGSITIRSIGTNPATLKNISVLLYEVWTVPLEKPTWAEARNRVAIPPTASERDQFWRGMIQNVIDNSPNSEERREEADKISVFRATNPDQEIILKVHESRNFPFTIALPPTFTPRPPPALNWHFELVGYAEHDKKHSWGSRYFPLPTVGSQIIGPQAPVLSPVPVGSQIIGSQSAVLSPVPAASPPVEGGWACPKCGNVNRIGAKFCDSCGTTSNMTCPQCGASLRLGAKFCDSCGTKI